MTKKLTPAEPKRPTRVNKAGKKIPVSRHKGHTFERLIANKFREAFPEAADEIRRSQQGAGALEPDVITLPGIWAECQCSNKPDPASKLAQATRDLAKWTAGIKDAADTRLRRVPVAITKDTKRHTIRAHFLLAHLNAEPFGCGAVMATVLFDDLLDLLRQGAIG